MRRPMGNGVAAQKAEFAIDADVIFVPERRHRDIDLALVAITRRGLPLPAALDCPAPVTVYLGAPCRFPLGRRAAASQRVLLGLGQAWPARLDHRGIDDLPAHRQPPLRP